MDSGFKILHRLIKAADVRQRVVSSNIANADTPGYKARDVKFGNMLEKEMKLKSTNPKHMSSENSINMWNQFVIEENPSWGDRNNVELNVEMAKMTENSLYHNAAIKLLNAKIKMFKSAIQVK
jgi:flagellar basal-body rod protein FlgB